MTSAFRRGLTWALCLVGITVGSLAWTAGVYLHTWADPSATTRVTEAVLADPESSGEVLAPVRAQVLAAIPPELGVPTDQIDAALDAVVADPAARARIADAFVTPDGDLRLTAAGEAFRDELIRQQPVLAPVLETWVPPLSLPDLSTATSARTAADVWVWRLAFVAAAAFVVSFVVGDRRRTARRFGYWSVATGALWLVGPVVATWLAPRVTGRLDATATVVVREYTRPIGPWALGLTIAGLVAISASFLVPSARTATFAEARSEPPPGRRARTSRPTTVEPAAPASSSTPTTRQIPATARNVAATRELPVQPAMADDGRLDDEAPTRPIRPSGEPADVDVWAAYESSAPSSSRPD